METSSAKYAAKSGPPFRAEHIGSLLRPQGLVEGAEDAAIAQVLRWQERLGLKVVTDGEFRRESWRLGFVTKVQGFARAEAIGDVDLQRDDAGNEARIGAAPLAVARLRRTGPIVADEVAFALKHTKCTVKATLPAPSYLHYPRGRACVDPKAYPDLEEFFDDVVRIYVEELHALHAAGGHYVQLDEVAQPLLCDDHLRATVRARGDDPDALIDCYIGLINRIARARPPGMTIGVHMCRGNAMGKWMASGSYEAIAERTFQTLEADVYFLEYDTPRAGSFEPLRFMPRGKRVVLGLVSTKSPVLEEPEVLERKVEQAARFVPMEQLSISPQCGFASHRKGSALTAAQQEAKLALVVRMAQRLWGEA
jgi:5-methyltetrahydropteroyltriglutamate--homocysteine methyltransferase